MSLLDRVDNEYLKRNVVTCEHCQHVNVIAGKSASKRKKRAHMVYCEDLTWFTLKAASATLGMNMADFLAFLTALWQREHRNVSAVTEIQEGVNPHHA